MYDFLVIGAGMIGSAAAKYLAQGGGTTAVLGPAEPTNVAAHEGVFGSHYDEGRITRRLDRDTTWATLAQRSIKAYRTIEQSSGISFYQPTGGLYMAAPRQDNGYLDGIQKTAERLQIPFERMDADSVAQRFPYLQLPATCVGLWEPPPAGIISPRELVRAQLAIAQQHGATLIRETAVSLQDENGIVTVSTLAGNKYRAQRVLLATGAFSNAYPLLSPPPALRIKTETVIMARLTPGNMTQDKMPALIYQIDHPVLSDIYLLPPLRYPDGHVYVKMGCNTNQDRTVTTLAEMREWIVRGKSETILPVLQAVLKELLPDLRPAAYTTHRCLIAYTAHGKPYIDAFSAGIFTAIGGNGVAAKSSDALGRLAADVVQNGRWTDSLDPNLFRLETTG